MKRLALFASYYRSYRKDTRLPVMTALHGAWVWSGRT